MRGVCRDPQENLNQAKRVLGNEKKIFSMLQTLSGILFLLLIANKSGWEDYPKTQTGAQTPRELGVALLLEMK